jgi:RNA polymerase sigma-70 factor (ECF subfamily)
MVNPNDMSELLTNDEVTDEEVARRVQQGDKEAFAFVVERYERKLFRYGRKFLSSQENIQDVVQEVFIKTYQAIQSFDTAQKFSPWIYRIAHNTFVNELKRQSKGPIYLFDFDALISHPIYNDPKPREDEEVEIKKMVEKGVEKLKPAYKEIIILYYIEELSYKEIADVLRVPIGTVGIRLKRAKEALKKIYQNLGMKYELQ